MCEEAGASDERGGWQDGVPGEISIFEVCKSEVGQITPDVEFVIVDNFQDKAQDVANKHGKTNGS